MQFMLRSLLFTVAFLVMTSVSARDLYWEDMRVDARLNADGSLHVIERQHYVFNGAWNGGERVFDLGWNEGLKILRISRIDMDTGEPNDLVAGPLDKVDQYNIINDTTLRWRSRLPEEAPFNNQHLIYEIEYLYTGIVKYRDGIYKLKHNFAFSKRPGDFNNYHLRLDIDPAWKILNEPLKSSVEAKGLAPGSEVIVQADMAYRKKTTPQFVKIPVPMFWRLLMILSLVLFVLIYLANWIYKETKVGRFERMKSVSSIDDAWLEEFVFSELPEQVGSLWDLDVGEAEVSAMLARMTLEGKLKSNIETRGFWIFKSSVLHLELLVDRSELTRNELVVIKGLFPDGDVTSTDVINEHYRNRGFDPASRLRSRLKSYRQKNKSAVKNRMLSNSGMLYLFAVACAIGGVQAGSINDVIIVIPALLIAILSWVFFMIKTYELRFEIQKPRRALFWMVFRYLILAALVSYFIISGLGQPSVWYIAMSLLIMAGLFAYLMDSTRSTSSSKEIALRKRLCSARRYFQHELKQPQPRLQDAWFPYLIAFGLDHSISKWFHRFGKTEFTGNPVLNSSSSSVGSVDSGWTGGGGSFGGAGATGDWTAAASSMSSGFSAPSSSSSGGSSSGGGSGGGGGGGW